MTIRTLIRLAAVVVGPAILLTVLIAGSATSHQSVTTDQPTYGPDDLVTITGANFLTDQALDVVVTTPDGFTYTGNGTGTSGFDSLVASGGGFIYPYQLASYGAGFYTIEVYDSGDVSHLTVLASTTFYDDTAFPASITAAYDTGSGVLTVSGTWTWDSCPNDNKAAGFAIFINGATPVSPGTGALDGTILVNTMHPVDMSSFVFPCPSTTTTAGTWGTDLTHTLGSAPTSVCVVMYDIHFDDLPPETGKHSTVGAGFDHNTDNSYERDNASPAKPVNAYGTADCTTPTVTPTSDTFQVRKQFDDNSTASVTVSLSCTGGGSESPATLSPAGSGTANTAGTAVEFTVSGFSGTPTCTATESPIPTGYTSTGTCAALLSVGTCTIVNTLLVTPPPGPPPVGGVVDIFVPGTSGDDAGAGAALIGLIFLAFVSLISAGSTAVWVSRRR